MHIISPHISCVVLPTELEQAMQEGYNHIFVMTQKGVIKHQKLRGDGRYIRLKCDTIPGYTEPEIKEEIHRFFPAGQVPYELFKQVVAFFKKVMDVKKSEVEAMIWILWNQEQGYHLHVPNQKISKASVSYDWSSVPAGSSIIVDIHSHNTMNSFFSSTDNADDRSNISFSGVVGKINDPEPTTVWRFNALDRKIDVKLENIFAKPPEADIAIPEDWLTKVETQTYVSTTPGVYQGSFGTHGNYGNYGGHGGYGRGGSSRVDVTERGDRQGQTTPFRGTQQMGFLSQSQGPGNRNVETKSPSGTSAGQSSSNVTHGVSLGEYQGEYGHYFGEEFGFSTFQDMAQDVPRTQRKVGDKVTNIENGEYVVRVIRADGTMEKVSSQNLDDVPTPQGPSGREVAIQSFVSAKDTGVAMNSFLLEKRPEHVLRLVDQYDFLAKKFDEATASAFIIIQDRIPAIEIQDELLEEVIENCFSRLTAVAQERMFRTMFDQLPKHVQTRIQSHGF